RVYKERGAGRGGGDGENREEDKKFLYHKITLSCVHTPCANKDGNMTEIPRMVVTATGRGWFPRGW
ncbi:hypothetical protein X777_03793, partial [Ooceraea biroi]